MEIEKQHKTKQKTHTTLCKVKYTLPVQVT